MFNYYEDGYIKKISIKKAYRMFITLVDNNQKVEGTTFKKLAGRNGTHANFKQNSIKQLFEGDFYNDR